MANLDGYSGLKTAAEIAAIPRHVVNDFRTVQMYDVAEPVGVVNTGSGNAPVYEERYILKQVEILPPWSDQDLREFTNAVNGHTALVSNAARASFPVSGGTVQVTPTFSPASTATVFWGDGASNTTTGTMVSHTYSAAGNYMVKIVVDAAGNLTKLVLDTANSGVDTAAPNYDFMKFNNLAELTMTRMNLTSVPGLPANLKKLNVGYNAITAIEGLPWGLTDIVANNNSLVTIMLPGGALKIVTLTDSKLSSTMVDSVLMQLNASGITAGTALLSQTPAAPPTAAGATAKTALQGKGWTVTTN